MLERGDRTEFVLDEIELKPLEAGEIRVRIQASGICHTDIALKDMVERPCVLGHEGTGTVEAVGPGVESLTVGDCVILGYASCGECSSCCVGSLNLCEHNFDLSFSGLRASGGIAALHRDEPLRASIFQQSSFSTRVIAQARNAVKVDSDLKPEIRASMTCSVFTGTGLVARQLHMGPGDSILIFGAGVVGLSAVMAASAVGATSVVVDPIQARRTLAEGLGAAETVDATLSDVSTEIARIFPVGAPAILDTSGVQSAWDMSIKHLGMGGKFTFVTIPKPMEQATLPAFELMKRGASAAAVIQGGAIPAEFIPQLVEWYRAGKLPLEKLITTYQFDEINDAFRHMSEHQVIKPVLIMEELGDVR